MKRLILFLLIIPSLGFAQTKISDMLTYAGDPAGGFVPVVLLNTNRKVDASYFGYNKIDSVSVSQGTTYDTLAFWKHGSKAFTKLTRAGGSSGGTTLPSPAGQAGKFVASDGTNYILQSDSANTPIGGGLTYKNNILNTLNGYALFLHNTTGNVTVADSVLSIYYASGGLSTDTLFLPDPTTYKNRIIYIHNSSPNAIPVYTSNLAKDANGGVIYYVGTTTLVSLASHRNMIIQSAGTSNWYMIGNNTNP